MALSNMGPWASANKGAVIASWTRGARAGLQNIVTPRYQYLFLGGPIPIGVSPVDIADLDYCPIIPPNHGSQREMLCVIEDAAHPEWPWYGNGNSGPFIFSDTQITWPLSANSDGTWNGTFGGVQWFGASRHPGVDGRSAYDDTTCQANGMVPWLTSSAEKFRIIGPAKGTLLQYPESDWLDGYSTDPLDGYIDQFGNPVLPVSAEYVVLAASEFLNVIPVGGSAAISSPADPGNPWSITLAPTIFRLGKTPADFGF